MEEQGIEEGEEYQESDQLNRVRTKQARETSYTRQDLIRAPPFGPLPPLWTDSAQMFLTLSLVSISSTYPGQ